MAVRTRAALAAGITMVALLAPMTASSSTFVLGHGPANACSRLALAGRSDNETLQICDLAIDDEFLERKDRAKTYVNRGVVHMRRQAIGSARRDFDRAQVFLPDLPEIYVNQAAILIKQGKYKEGIALTDKGLALNPDEPEKAYFNRGLAREATGDLKGAYLDYTKAIELKPDYAPAQKELQRFELRRPG